MTVSDHLQQGKPLVVAERALAEVSEAVREFAESSIARAKTRSAERGAVHKVRAIKMKNQISLFRDEVLSVKPEDLGAARDYLVEGVPSWIRMMDELLDAGDEAESLSFASPRELRRKNAVWLQNLVDGNVHVEEIKNILLDLLEHLDPTPVDYLESEARRIHGNDAERILKSFEGIASSDAFTTDAFKKRHNIR